MSSAWPIYVSLAVPTFAAPSANCLQWTADGQLVLVTKTAVHVLTPDVGVASDLSSAAKSALPLEGADPAAEPPRTFGLFKTMLEFARTAVHIWPLLSQEWATVALGSLDVSLRMVTASPSHLIGIGRCVLAVLNSNLELTLHQAATHHLRGEWSKIQDVTAYLHELVATGAFSTTVRTLHAQASCIAWSPQARFGVTPVPAIDGSLLAVATRAGVVRFFRYCSADSGSFGRAVHLDLVAAADGWISHLAWTPWVSRSAGTSHALLACACADGSVKTIEVTQHLEQPTTPSAFNGNYTVRLALPEEPSPIGPPDGRGVTALRWACQPGGEVLALACCKPGTVQLYALAGGATAWSGARTFALRPQRLSVDASALHPATGLEYIPARDAFLVGLFDGSVHVVNAVSTAPRVDAPDESADGGDSDSFSTENISQRARAVFVRAETEGLSAHPRGKTRVQITPKDANRTSGLTSYDGGSTLVWLHEACRPSDFSYKHDARHVSRLVAAQMWAEDADVDVLVRLQHLFAEERTPGHVGISVLRPFLLYFRKKGRVAELVPRLLEILQPPADVPEIPVAVPAQSIAMSDEVRRSFRLSLAAHLFGWPTIDSLRLKLATATYTQQQLPTNSPIRGQLGQVVLSLINALTHHILLVLLRHLAAVTHLLTLDDVPFALRVALQSMFPSCPAELTAEGTQLMLAIEPLRVSPTADSDGDAASEPAPRGFEERCPACSAEIVLANLIDAECAYGHVWGRCSITSFVLATPRLRTCVGCGRKALLPSAARTADEPEFLPDGARGWFARELLEAATRCLFCGNGFFTLV